MTEEQSIANEFINSLAKLTEKGLKDEKSKREKLNFDLDKEIAALEQSIKDIRADSWEVAHIPEERAKVNEQLAAIQAQIDEKKHLQAGNVTVIKHIDKLVRAAKEKREDESMLRFLKASGIRDLDTLKARIK